MPKGQEDGFWNQNARVQIPALLCDQVTLPLCALAAHLRNG